MQLGLDLSQIIILGLGCLVWFLRIEGRVKAIEREHELIQDFVRTLHGKHDQLNEKVISEISSMKLILARIEERLTLRDG